MRHTLPTATTTLWILNVGYVILAEIDAGIRMHAPGQRLLIGIAITVTVAWLLHRHGIEYRIGYRQGRQDRKNKE